jgi:cleavage and polyadenylation specificity factor subunit 1
VFRADGLLPGGGLCLQKVAFGATVRRIQYIDRNSEAPGGSCLYAVLISREQEIDSSQLNEDGMTKDEREQLEKEKEAAKVKRQVEADLGGFDVEQEWVEEIEREDCFRVEKELGGAPPLLVTTYSLWIVDAANGWMVADSYELGENYHGMAMCVMALTDVSGIGICLLDTEIVSSFFLFSQFPDEPGSFNTTQVATEDMESTLFIAVGIAVVDKNGEDVSGKGKVLLFELRSNSEGLGDVELALTCAKDIFHGPVMSLSCLTSEGKNRILIGAGADINVEQWGNGKLTQVGFFRATMQVLDIFVFKNFLLLSECMDAVPSATPERASHCFVARADPHLAHPALRLSTLWPSTIF